MSGRSSAPRIPNSETYWINKGKVGKKVMIYFHDDMDGIFSAIAIKKYLISHGFEIEGYGIINYQESWSVIKVDKRYINIAVDFADINSEIDVYIDHHGDFLETDDVDGLYAVKTKTHSAYEGIMDQLGLPIDGLVSDVINMIDSALYDEYEVAWTDLMTFDYEYFLSHKKPKLMFAGVANQYLKRSDYRTFIEVVKNATEPSIYQIFRLFKIFYPMNNADWRVMRDVRRIKPDLNEFSLYEGVDRQEYESVIKEKKTDDIFKDFIEDGSWRLRQVENKTRGSEDKVVIKSQQEFLDRYLQNVSYSQRSRSKYAGMSADVIKLDGYVIIGKLAFIPSGTWANAIRARTIIEQDIDSGRLSGVKKEDILWVLLQYGDTLQLVSFKDINGYDENILPRTKKGDVIDNLKVYLIELVEKFKKELDFVNDNTLAGGHKGIGTISNIGSDKLYYAGDNEQIAKLSGTRYADLFKNYIIANLSEVPWSLNMSWENPFKYERDEEPTPMNARVMMQEQIRRIDTSSSNSVYYPNNYRHKENMNDIRRFMADIREKQKQAEKDKTEEELRRLRIKHDYYRRKREDGRTFEEYERQHIPEGDA